MSDLVGDVSHLHRTVVPFSAVHVVQGHNPHGSFLITDCTGFSALSNARASVKIVSDSLTVKVVSPGGADKVVSGAVAIIPDTATNPTSVAHVLSIGGHAYVEHSVYNSAGPVPVRFAAEAAHQIKPTPLVGSPPKVVFALSVLGGDTNTTSTLVLQGSIEVDGIGFTRTW